MATKERMGESKKVGRGVIAERCRRQEKGIKRKGQWRKWLWEGERIEMDRENGEERKEGIMTRKVSLGGEW